MKVGIFGSEYQIERQSLIKRLLRSFVNKRLIFMWTALFIHSLPMLLVLSQW